MPVKQGAKMAKLLEIYDPLLTAAQMADLIGMDATPQYVATTCRRRNLSFVRKLQSDCRTVSTPGPHQLAKDDPGILGPKPREFEMKTDWPVEIQGRFVDAEVPDDG